VRKIPLIRQAALLAAIAALGAYGAIAPTVATAATGPAAASRPAPHAPGATGLPTAPRVARLPAGERRICPVPTRPGQMECMSIVRTAPAGTGPAVTVRGYGPSALLSAYKLRSVAGRGRGKVIAIVDAFNDPRAAPDLATYRSHFRLGACTRASHCLRIVNEHGSARNLPRADAGWAGEESLDLDMVSAICPKCRILLVEATNPTIANLGTAVSTAVAMGARYVSNSWSGIEFTQEGLFNHFFNHPGEVIDFASGDFGFGAAYPTDLQYVTAIGGTTLRHTAHGRGWSETVWGSSSPPGSLGTGSGCSALAPKPSWQRADDTSPTGCLNRTENDVAAVANPNTGVAVFDSYRNGGWFPDGVGGTSAATPIITAIYALAGTPTRSTYPAEYPYLHNKHLFDVTSGSNGSCSPRQYLCHGEHGYDGPTGLGTPNGPAAFTDSNAHRVTLLDPGNQSRTAGSSFTLQVTGLDTRSGATSLHFTATGLPGGLSIHAIAHSTNGKITGTLPGSAGTFDVTVTAKDGRITGTTHFIIVVAP
jgi:hypothetical protein